MDEESEGTVSCSRQGEVKPVVHEGETSGEDEALARKRRMLSKFGVKVFEDDKLMPIDGGKAQTKKLMEAYKDKEIKLTVMDKLDAGYPVEERAKQLICEGKIREGL